MWIFKNMFFIEHLRATAFEEEKQLNNDDELRVFRWVKSDTQDRKVSYSNLASRLSLGTRRRYEVPLWLSCEIVQPLQHRVRETATS